MVLPISQVNETQAFVLWVLVISTIANRHHFAFLFPQITCNLNWITLSLRYLTKKERKAFSTIVFWCGASECLWNKVLLLALAYCTLVQFSGGFSNWFISEAPKPDALFQLDTNYISVLNEYYSPKQQCDLLADSDVMGMFCAAVQTKSSLK